jgi:hypothetical protein
MSAADIRLVRGPTVWALHLSPQSPRTIRGERLAEPLATYRRGWLCSERCLVCHRPASSSYLATNPLRDTLLYCEGTGERSPSPRQSPRPSHLRVERTPPLQVLCSVTRRTTPDHAPPAEPFANHIVPTPRMALHGRCNAVPHGGSSTAKSLRPPSAFVLAFVN